MDADLRRKQLEMILEEPLDDVEAYKILEAVIKSGVKEKDYEYFSSETFEHHCDMLGVNVNVMRAAVNRHMGGH